MTNAPTQGSLATLNAILATQCTEVTKDGHFIFVMNLFNAEVNAGNGDQSPSAMTKSSLSDGDGGLGDDMYFEQTPQGEIVNVWYQEGDSPYFVNVKLGAINSLQTRIVSAPQSALVSDVVGVHTSAFAPSGGPAGAVTVTSTFTQSGFKSFADPSVTTRTFSIQGTNAVTVAKGQVVGASVDQVTVYVDATVQASPVQRRGDPDLSGFNMNMRASGKMNVTQAQSLVAKAKFSSPVKTSKALSADPRMKVSKSLAEAAKVAIALGKVTAAAEIGRGGEVALREALQAALAAGQRASTKIEFAQLRAAIELLTSIPDRNQVTAVLLPHAETLSGSETPALALLRKRLLFVLVAAGTSPCQDVLVAHGIRSTSAESRLHAIMASSAVAAPGYRLLDALSSAATDDNDKRVSSAALMALGTVLSRSTDVPRVEQGAQLLLQLLNFALAQHDFEQARVVLHSILNAGQQLIPVTELPRAAFTTPGLLDGMESLLREAAVNLDGKAGQAALTDSSLPFNRTYGFDFALGGKIVGADFGASVFAGTNMDCKHPTFNYLGSAQANASLWLFGHDQSAFLATAAYGRVGGAPAADAITLSVWGKVVYNQNIPVVDCSVHSYPISHASPGFSVSHTIWVSVIPVTFAASADLDLNLAWSWQICDSTLSATVSLLPSATLVVTGSATVDLLIVKASADLQATFNQGLTPSAGILGSLCELDFVAKLSNAPMTAEFDVSYQFKKCKLWIFDCHWENPNTKTVWSWSGAPQSKTIFNKTIPIALAKAKNAVRKAVDTVRSMKKNGVTKK